MIIWDSVERLVQLLAALRQRYRCLVDGHDEFCGEPLPIGTADDILAWIQARYKVLGELYDVDLKRSICHWYSLIISPDMWKPEPMTKRYLVEVNGAARIFVLHPVQEDLLGWHPELALTWSGNEWDSTSAQGI